MLRTEFVRRVSIEIFTQLLEALVSDGVLDDLEKESILEENQTRANKARCLIDTVKKKRKQSLQDNYQPSSDYRSSSLLSTASLLIYKER